MSDIVRKSDDSAAYFVHANVNTADLVRAEAFYTDVLGLSPQIRTAPTDGQDGRGFALEGLVRWKGVLLGDHRAPKGAMVDLLEWIEPPTEGEPSSELNCLGLSSLMIDIASLQTVRQRLGAAASECRLARFGEPTGEREALIAFDLDGTRIELYQADVVPCFRGVRVNCSALDRSLQFYTGVLGLRAGPVSEVIVLDDSGSEIGRFRATRLTVVGQPHGFFIDLTQWEAPAPVGPPAGGGNRAGIYRVCLGVRDIDASHRLIAAAMPASPAPTEVAIVDGQPPIRASFYPDPDGAVMELIQIPETSLRNAG
ncbi:MAG TPA: hypothetical protein VG435_01300 [Acidimicrobiales bacterium]|jgi:catechol 2,3-dioxygenase-like lactoylglutathione lyase family enzyme|nr:hypothetical protein [Acidimicrobiales bacterium]